MNNPIEYEMLAKIQQAELLKAAVQQRAARIARGEGQRPAFSWRAVGLSLAAAATVAVVVLSGAR